MKTVTLIVLLSLLSIQISFATSWRINNKVGIDANFTSLQQANDTSAVHNGDTIYCDNGAFVGSATISKQLFIIGPGYFLTQVDTAYANPSSSSVNELTFDSGSDGSTITGMRITGYVKFTYCSSITVERCKIKTVIDGFFGSSEGNNFIIRQCYIYDGISLGYTKSIDIYNNIIIGNISISAYSTNQVTIENNVIVYNNSNVAVQTDDCSCVNNIICTYNNVYSLGTNNSTFSRNVVVKYPNSTSAITQTQPSGTNIWGTVTMDSVFVENGAPDAYYQLKTGSPAIGYCQNNKDAGAFDGAYEYILCGFPMYFPRIYEDLSTGTATSSGIPIHIKAKSQSK